MTLCSTGSVRRGRGPMERKSLRKSLSAEVVEGGNLRDFFPDKEGVGPCSFPDGPG